MKGFGAIAAGAVVVGLAGCGGGKWGGSTSDDGSTNSYRTVHDLTGRTRVRYSRGGIAWATEFVYLTTGELNGVGFAGGTGTHVNDAISGGIAIDSLACQVWADVAAASDPDGVLPEPSETYLCTWSYPSGASNWYAISIAPDGTVSGQNAYEDEDGGSGALTTLIFGNGTDLQGEHEPNWTRAKQADPSSPEWLYSVYEELDALR